MSKTINCRGQLIDLTVPKVMGILNVTPDSFYDGGRFRNKSSILKQVDLMIDEGATFIDVGAYSSRPGANHISEAEELERILPIVEFLIKNFPNINLSVDTFRSPIAKACIASGACMINDISAGHLDKDMIPTISELSVPYIMMHMRGTPQTMKTLTSYSDLVKDVTSYFAERIAHARSAGVTDLIIDPGFGFAKTLEQNYDLLNKLELLQLMELPLLAGVSRKSMIYKTLGTDAEHALNGTTTLNTVALMKGANILRVHDVKEAIECVKLLQQLSNS